MTPGKKEKKTVRPLTSVMEDYLEAIFELGEKKRVVRVKDIAARMDVKMPTVTSMLKTLSERNLVRYEKYEYVELTGKGAAIGREIGRRHEILLKFLTEILRINHDTADEDACKMEHALSIDTLDSLTDFMKFIQACPRAGDTWLEFFEEYRRHGRRPEACQARIGDFLCDFREKTDFPDDAAATDNDK